ncbi:hypothetical protein HETIRDRAFT_324419 [Heterobasidion irregulare TC 32-1]|uniref:BTB domain-containing protein n=1 Tax=Heterobasidion irregulare (strain TC 32-1) TaxID=747525 RepID=W4JZK2_HETIT|nr:uncharacterized protein HETIRDRAFT_324419 [Heterobasidion irregulare TC 32-1]ETW78515.1 hypothetical protein HETIRDRAFT_324419 [Heterobasidion irregulare TC 32-1]
MTLLHIHFALRNQHAFQRLLEGGSARGQPPTAAGISGSGGRSWTRPSALSMAMSLDVNARDWLGRTTLHLACSASDPASVEYVRLLLAHPAINVNVQDTESQWTALHRALYHGNISAAILLLQRADIDTALTDLEGYRAFDLYNTTVEATKPVIHSGSDGNSSTVQLFTWGANRNAALGHGDSGDRHNPEHVSLRRHHEGDHYDKDSVSFALDPPSVRQVEMSRLHTVVVTNEPRANIRLCGFASTGRLGPGGGQHSIYSLSPMPQFPYTVVSVALGQDHTLALIDTGAVFSWGLNRFSQLGYVIETNGNSRLDDPVQATPRIISGPLKHENVIGIAACKTASACWTDKSVYTWGKNNGQLGYDKSSQPVQVQPRLVTRVTKPVISIVMTDSAMACLLKSQKSQEVVLLFNDGYTRINFPSQTFPSEITTYYPPQARNTADIAKIVCNDTMFAAVSSNGEVFTFTVPTEQENGASKEKLLVRPQRVWALRKQWSAVRDVALGSDGSIIVCTESGHVFVRSRNLKSGQGSAAKTFKFQRVNYIQRVVAVGANDTGAMNALRHEFRPDSVSISGNTLPQDLAKIRPYLKYSPVTEHNENALPAPGTQPSTTVDTETLAVHLVDHNDDPEDWAISSDIAELRRLWDVISQDKLCRQKHDGRGLFDVAPLALGADIIICARRGIQLPAHRLVLSARCLPLSDLLSRKGSLHDKESGISITATSATAPSAPFALASNLPRLTISGCHALSVLILLHYFYTDELLAIWDNRVSHAMGASLVASGLQSAQLTRELQGLSRALGLNLVTEAARAASKRSPEPTMSRHLNRLFLDSQSMAQIRVVDAVRSPLAGDIVLELADRQVFCHSAVLRARTLFFECLFDDEDWTSRRWSEQGVVNINLRHLSWRAMDYVLRFVYGGEEREMFEKLEPVKSVDSFLDLIFDVMSAANELLLDRLLLVCSSVLLQYVNVNNVCNILVDAAYLQCAPLVKCLHQYMAVNMEALLESRMLDDLDPRLIRALSMSICDQQISKSPVSRSGRLLSEAMNKNTQWLALQDIPRPIVCSAQIKDSPRLSPKRSRRSFVDQFGSPSIRAHASSAQPISGDDMFQMDDADVVPTLNLNAGSPWKSKSAGPKVDMKAILAEAQGTKLAEGRGSRNLRYTNPPASDGPSTPQPWVIKTSSKDNLKSSIPTPPGTGISVTERANSSWRVTVPTSTPSLVTALNAHHPPLDTPVHTPPSIKGATPPNNSRTVPQGGPAQLPSNLRSALPEFGLGPVFTPSRQSIPNKSPAISRHISGGSAWTLPPVQPVVRPSIAGSVMSFAAIQQLQHEQGATPVKDKRSLKEIQEEEQARRAEEEFLKWWTAEEERVRMESEVTSASTIARSPKGPSKKSKSEAKSKTSKSVDRETDKPGKRGGQKQSEQSDRKASTSNKNTKNA